MIEVVKATDIQKNPVPFRQVDVGEYRVILFNDGAFQVCGYDPDTGWNSLAEGDVVDDGKETWRDVMGFIDTLNFMVG